MANGRLRSRLSPTECNGLHAVRSVLSGLALLLLLYSAIFASRSDLGWARGHPSWQMHPLTKKQLSSEIEGRCSAAAVLLFSCNLFRFFANLLSSTLSRQGLLHPALCARLQVEGVALHFLNDVFRLNLALESTERVLYGLAFLQPNFCQTHHLPTRSKSEIPEPTLFVARSGERIAK